MAPDLPTTAETDAACQLRIVEFYLPRLLAIEGPPAPEWWWYAFSLQQLAESVLNPSSKNVQQLPPEHERALRWLSRVHSYLRSQLCLPPERRTLERETAAWEVVQRLLARTMPLVEQELQATLAAEKRMRMRMQPTNRSGRIWTVPGLAWLTE